MKEQYQEVTQDMPILGSKYTKSIPLGMFDNFREKLMLYYGRSPERLSTHRGLTVKEALEIFFTSGTMPPKEFYEGALQGEVSIYKQVREKGGEYGPPVYTDADYKDCQPVVFRGEIAHLKYMKMVDKKDDITRPLPKVLYYVRGTDEFFSYDFGVAINRTRELRAPFVQPLVQPMQEGTDLTVSPLGQLKHRAETLFDAIKHGDEDHQAWLKEAIRCHFAGEPMPEYVAGKSKVGQKVAEFFDNLQSEQKPINPDFGNIWASGQESHPSRYIHRPDEPFFVLLARDPQAPDILEYWADLRELAEPGDWKIENARQTARDMRVFKAGNPNFGMGKDLYDKVLPVYLQQQAEQYARLVPITEMTNLPPKRMTVDLDATIGKPVANPHIGLLADVARQNVDALPLALQLVNAQPCQACGYIHTHCRCVTPKEDKPTHLVVSTIPPEWPADHPVLKGEWKLP